MARDANGHWVGYGVGDSGPQVAKIQHRLLFAYPRNSHAVEHGVTESGTFDLATKAALIDLTTFLDAQGKKLRVDGIADYAVQVAIGAYIPPPQGRRYPIQGVGYNTNAFLQPDPMHSYVQCVNEGTAEGLRLALPDTRPKIGIGYSQGGDVVNNWIRQWPADRQGEIKMIVTFGSPARRPGPTLLGDDPPGSGISRNYTPQWAWDRTYDFAAPGDMYPEAPDDSLLPQLYQILIRAAATPDFALYLFNILGSTFGGALLGQSGNSSLLGFGSLSGILGLITPGPATQPSGQINLLAMITNIPAIVETLIVALEFIITGAHGTYGDPAHANWDGMTGVDKAVQLITQHVPTAVIYLFPGTWSSWNQGFPMDVASRLP